MLVLAPQNILWQVNRKSHKVLFLGYAFRRYKHSNSENQFFFY